ncbi:hypothetical protein Bhyg_13028 [Pseudolycoriella hygida]|uniref:Transmembrane protein n=1 Tax=Pseudolycoriella hygida TaxID=35572 RepID=A0A9Q0S1V2_9DIPT|nr:hypothetical protein Bhyg_13028 [Pseudolycoriella hygida]
MRRMKRKENIFKCEENVSKKISLFFMPQHNIAASSKMAKLIKFISSVLLIIVLIFISMPTSGHKMARVQYDKAESRFVFDAVRVVEESETQRQPK